MFLRTCSFVTMLLAIASAALAQGAVRGTVSILEHPGGITTDLGNVVVYLEPTSGVRPRASPTVTSIALQSRQFAPRVRILAAGSTVVFPNQDPFNHNVFSKAPQGPFDTESYGRGKTRQNVFRAAGVYPIYCNVHPRMTAFVIAVNTPYFAPAGNDGQFSISGVPAGKYRIHIWHDRGGARVADLVVPAAGLAGLRYELDARGYRYVGHKNKFGGEYANALGDIY
ncbi:MAG TPA: hypothetical protein VF159_10350 [Gemmatimonadaceae bacterium]